MVPTLTAEIVGGESCSARGVSNFTTKNRHLGRARRRPSSYSCVAQTISRPLDKNRDIMTLFITGTSLSFGKHLSLRRKLCVTFPVLASLMPTQLPLSRIPLTNCESLIPRVPQQHIGTVRHLCLETDQKRHPVVDKNPIS